MPSFPLIGNKAVTKAEFFARNLENAEALESAAAPEAAHPLKDDFAALNEIATKPGATQFVAIGPNKPLTVLLRHVYTGRYPKSIFGGSKPMVIVTALKDYALFSASSRAVNFLEKDVNKFHHFKAPNAFNQGTNVVAYTPAVVTDSLTFTVEIAFDSFPDQLMNTISNGLAMAAGVPLLMPAQGYLLAASSILKIGSDWADALIDGKAAFSATDTLDFNIPGAPAPSADFRVLTRGLDAAGMTYQPGKGLLSSAGTLYDGDEPYVVISLDGAERTNLEKFAPTLATASVLKQFFNLRDGAEVSIEALLGALRLANDMHFREQARDVKKLIEKEPEGAKKDALKQRLEALEKNISNEELKLSK